MIVTVSLHLGLVLQVLQLLSSAQLLGLTELMTELSWLEIELTGELVDVPSGPDRSFWELSLHPRVTIAIVAAIPAVAARRRVEKNEFIRVSPSRGNRCAARASSTRECRAKTAGVPMM